MNSLLKSKNLSSAALQTGLAFVFLYAAIASLLHPLEWSGFLPGFLVKIVDPTLLLRTMAVFEIILAIGFLTKYKRYSAALSVLMFAGIIVTNLSQFIITFRDIGLLFAAVALFFIQD